MKLLQTNVDVRRAAHDLMEATAAVYCEPAPPKG